MPLHLKVMQLHYRLKMQTCAHTHKFVCAHVGITDVCLCDLFVIDF